jgi:hypothetical protein
LQVKGVELAQLGADACFALGIVVKASKFLLQTQNVFSVFGY